tara:strand:+ start:59 stop:964 length:906 start_codon:yes stop_codon:yes gene_type:complete
MEKTIKISPDLFKIKSGHSGGRSKTRSNKNVKRLLSKIKEHAKQHSKHSKEQNTSDIIKPQTTNFNQHIEYLESIRQKRKKTRSNRPQEQVNLTVPEGLTQVEIKPPPQYGILKGGPTPTMREWKRKTQKNYEPNNFVTSSQHSQPQHSQPHQPHQHKPIQPQHSQSHQPHQHKPIQPQYSQPQDTLLSQDKKQSTNTPASVDMLKRKVENKFKLGPSKDKKTTSIYISNRRTRKKIQDDIQVLNKASLSQVKSYLKKHQLYKSGSDAPPDLLREIYRSAHLAGKPVVNKSPDNLIHNFYS